jgi:hypothetical protein
MIQVLEKRRGKVFVEGWPPPYPEGYDSTSHSPYIHRFVGYFAEVIDLIENK